MRIIEDFIDDESDLLVNNYEDEYLEEPSYSMEDEYFEEPAGLEYPMEDEDEFELENSMIIPQDDYDVVLEKGDRIKIVSKDLKEAVDLSEVDFNDFVSQKFHYEPLIRYFNDLNIPVKDIVFDEDLRNNTITASAGKWIRRDLGIFSYVLNSVELKTFGSRIIENKYGHPVWVTTWAMEYETRDKGENGISFTTSWCDLLDYTWQFQGKG
jgi:hypothetical protein